MRVILWFFTVLVAFGAGTYASPETTQVFQGLLDQTQFVFHAIT